MVTSRMALRRATDSTATLPACTSLHSVSIECVNICWCFIKLNRSISWSSLSFSIVVILSREAIKAEDWGKE